MIGPPPEKLGVTEKLVEFPSVRFGSLVGAEMVSDIRVCAISSPYAAISSSLALPKLLPPRTVVMVIVLSVVPVTV